MASTEGLVPITREYLANFYDKYVFGELSEDVPRLSTQLRQCCSSLLFHSRKRRGEELMVSEMECNPPHKIDENLWKNREYIEEILFSLDKAHLPTRLQAPEHPADMAIVTAVERFDTEVKNILKSLQSFQAENTERIFNMIVTYMPQDFRGTLLKQQRERSERKRQAEVEAVVNSGGSIHDKYGLLWKQQMDRRKQLAQLGSATGVYKTIVKYLVGVPEVLLDFVRKVNDHHGPMEEQRLRYGPPLYQLTRMAFSVQLFLKLWWRHFDECELPKDDLLSLLEQSIQFVKPLVVLLQIADGEKPSMDYIYEGMDRVKETIFFFFVGNRDREVFKNSPFLISAEEAGARDPNRCDDFKETTIPAGKTHEVLLALDTVNSYIAWDFKLTSGKDVGFCVELIGQSGQNIAMFPYKRCESDQGNFCTPKAGTYRIVWDNSYSTFYKKVLRYKVDAFPPVVETT